MSTRLLLAALLISVVAIDTSPIGAQNSTAQSPGVPRAIRRDIPLTASIQRAYAAGTRDMTGRPGPNYWQLEVDYTIHAKLDPPSETITGTETLQLHNNSPAPLTQIVFRLDHNMFRGLAQRTGSVPAENTDGCVVTSMSVNGQSVDLSNPQAGGRVGQPGSGNRAVNMDQSVATVLLASPIPAKSTATLEIAWHTKLPGGPGRGHRMTQRFDDTMFQPAQWYPRVAKYDDMRGWDTNPYLGPSEFYNNFGRFDVYYDVPAGWIVSSTGVLQNEQEVLTAAARERLSHVLESDNVITIVGPDEIGPGQATAAGDRLVWHFVAEKVNDVAWATGQKLVWTATRATIPGKGPIPVSMFFRPSMANQFQNAGPIARHALEFYSKLWMPYPFPKFALQDGPNSGMEYPMVINSNAGPADHETGHQWWPMTVGNNETRYGWMDEGFNQYMNVLSDADAAHKPPSFDGAGQSYGRQSGNEDEPMMMWNANYGGPMYSFQTYGKTPLMLSMLGGIVGDEAVQRAMSDYAKTWSFKNPSPWDYINFMSNSLKMDLGWFWYYWLWTTESVDSSIQKVTTAAGKTTVTIRQDGQMPSPIVLKVTFTSAGPAINAMPNVKWLDEHNALVTWPVDVWFNGSRTYDAVLNFGARPIESIALDPYGRFPDKNAADNVWKK